MQEKNITNYIKIKACLHCTCEREANLQTIWYAEQFAYCGKKMTTRSTGNKSVESWKMVLSVFYFCSCSHLSVDSNHKHDVLDSGQVLKLMSWNRSRDLVFTIASGSHIKDCVFAALLILRGLSSMPVCESHLVMSGAYKQSFNQRIVWGEFF